jgi:hypothetical protein
MDFSRTISVLEKMLQNLDEKWEKGILNGELVKTDIKALENIIKFTNMILSNFPEEMIEKIANDDIEQKENILKGIIEKYNIQNNGEMIAGEEYETIYTDEIKLMIGKRILFSVVNYGGNKYVLLEPQRFMRNMLQWKNWGERFNFPKEIIKKNRKIINEINLKGAK